MTKSPLRVLTHTALVALMGLGLAACGNDDAVDPRAEDERTLTLFAAASLTDTFTDLAETFEDQHEGVTVELSFGGSSALVSQLQEGAPADVFAAADEKTMQVAADDDLLAGEAIPFATNTLVVVTPPDNPAGVQGLADLARPDVETVVCAPQVPCGAAAESLEEAAGVDISPASEEQAVTDVLAKVVAGEADAGLVYVTDAESAGDDVETIEVPEAADVVNTYPIAALADARHTDLAQDWITLVTGDDGQQMLADAGFGAP